MISHATTTYPTPGTGVLLVTVRARPAAHRAGSRGGAFVADVYNAAMWILAGHGLEPAPGFAAG